jgi:hypothetical protein
VLTPHNGVSKIDLISYEQAKVARDNAYKIRRGSLIENSNGFVVHDEKLMCQYIWIWE